MSPPTSGNDPASERPTAPGPLGDLTPSDISEAYLRRSIAEIEDLNRQILECRHCVPSVELPVLASGNPQADIFFVKWSASLAERQEGVAFFGRAGTAILKSLERLAIDPTTIYGTLAIKCSHIAESRAARICPPWLADEIAIVMPKLIVTMGARALEAVNGLDYPMAQELATDVGRIQRWTPTTEALFVPDIDDSLDEQGAKRAFWSAFRAIGEWHASQPPY